MLYYAEHLKVSHRKDLAKKGLEAIWIQIKFPSNSALFSVVYFFEDVYELLEKAWMRTSNIFMIGDFNCDLLNINDTMTTKETTQNEKITGLVPAI